ncbi:hypothetical protein Vadar_008406 [Vaccinium darrowii]|uniref:Uncharacterized protein n=1 Tax=Vaccinium darrowii TaxID=229202 RepID=A0ACB7YL74_9ERIC|nr:hypothetical protein Vadar_008406 [Vaccinium darrowii]
MEKVKETAAKIAASAESGMEKTKATVQEKPITVSEHMHVTAVVMVSSVSNDILRELAWPVEKMTTIDPVNKEMAEQKKEERIVEAELKKREEWELNTAGTRADATPIGESQSYSTTGERGRLTGMHQMSTLPGHRTGSLPGGWWKGGCHPTPSELRATGTDRPSTAHNPGVGFATNKGYGTGGAYT